MGALTVLVLVILMAPILLAIGLFLEWVTPPPRFQVEQANQSRQSPPPTVFVPRLPQGNQEYVPRLDDLIGSTGWIAANVGNAANYEDDLVERATQLKSRAGRSPAAGTLEAFQQAMQVYAQAPADEPSQHAARDELRSTLSQLLRKDRYAGTVAFELGMMALADGYLSIATRHFTHAIAVAPDDPAGWYGYGASALAVQDQYGALSLAEMMLENDAQGEALRQRFPSALLVQPGLNPDRFAIVSARARMRAAALRGMLAPKDVTALAAKQLP